MAKKNPKQVEIVTKGQNPKVNLSQFRPERHKHCQDNEDFYGCLENHVELRY